MYKRFGCRDIIVGVAVILATVVQFRLTSLLQEIEDAKDILFDKSIALAVTTSGLAANSSEIILQRDLLEACEVSGLKICGSSELLLKQAAIVRDSIRGDVINSEDELQKSSQNYKTMVSRSKLPVFVYESLFYILMLVAILFTLLKPRQSNNP